jgi:hypothetical protein
MGILDLIKKVGEDNLMLQLVGGSLVKAADKKRMKDTEITIATTQINASQAINDNGKVGIVVWIDRKDYDEAIK